MFNDAKYSEDESDGYYDICKPPDENISKRKNGLAAAKSSAF